MFPENLIDYKLRTNQERKKESKKAKNAFKRSLNRINKNLLYSAFIQTEGMLSAFMAEVTTYEDPIREYFALDNYEKIIQKLKEKEKMSELEKNLLNECENRLKTIGEFNKEHLEKYFLDQKI